MVKSADYHRGRAAGLAWFARRLTTWDTLGYRWRLWYVAKFAKEEAARDRAKARGKRG